jgi:hypothetical protein
MHPFLPGLAVNMTAALLTWLDNKHLQQLRIASVLSSVAMEYGDLGMASDVLNAVSTMVSGQRRMVRWVALVAFNPAACCAAHRASALMPRGASPASSVLPPLLLQMMLGINGLKNSDAVGILDICSAGSLSTGDGTADSEAFNNLWSDASNCGTCGWGLTAARAPFALLAAALDAWQHSWGCRQTIQLSTLGFAAVLSYAIARAGTAARQARCAVRASA